MLDRYPPDQYAKDMKVLVLYRPNSEHGRAMESLLHEFGERYHGADVEGLNIDSREGQAAARLYDIVQYPAILVVQGNGSLQQLWQGEPLPLMDEVAAYARS